MTFSNKSLQKWALVQLFHLLLVQNIFATPTDKIPPWLVTIGIKGSPQQSYGSLITSRAVLTSAEAVVGVREDNLEVMKDCEMILFLNSDLNLCFKRKVSAIYLLGNPDMNDFSNNVAVLFLNSPFEQYDTINIATSIDTINEDNCFFTHLDFLNSPFSLVKSVISKLYRVSFLKNPSDITLSIQTRLKEDIEYAISNETINLIDTSENYSVILDKSKDFLGNPLICTLKKNSSTYVQIGVASGYVTLKNPNDLRIIIGQYYIDITKPRLQIIELTEERERTFFDSILYFLPFNLS